MAITVKKDRVKKLDPSEMIFSGTAAEAIVAGALVSQSGAGLIKNAATTDGYGVFGVALDSVSTGEVVQYANGTWEVTASGFTVADTGDAVYALDNDAVTLSSNSCFAGRVASVEGSRVFVKIGFPQA